MLTEKSRTDAIQSTFAQGTTKTYERGKLILHMTAAAENLYYISDGFVRIYTLNSLGEQFTHVVYMQGELFPLPWLVSKVNRDVYYEALTDCTILTLPRLQLIETLKTNAELSYEMMQKSISQYLIYTDRVENLEHKFASERLAYSLLFMASRYGEQRPDGILIKAPITHQVLGSTINLSRESVSRELDKLVQKGLIASEGRRFVIKDLNGLAKQFKKPISPDWWGMHKA